MAIPILAILLLGWVPAAPRLGPPIPVRIEVQGPTDCPAGPALLSGIQARAERVREAQGDEKSTLLRVRLSVVAGRIRGELQVVDKTGASDRRRVEGATCQEVVQALSLTAALALDPTAGLAPATEPPADGSKEVPGTPSGGSQPPVELPPKGPKVPEPIRAKVGTPLPQSPSSAKSWRLEAAAALLVGQVSSPGVGVGGGLSARIRGLRGQALGPSLGIGWRALHSDVFGSERQVSVVWNGLTVAGCPLSWTVGKRLQVEPCATTTVALIAAEGRNIDHPQPVKRVEWSLGGLLRGSLSLGHGVSFEIEGGLSLPMVRREFFVSTAPGSDTVTAPLQSRTVAKSPLLAPVGGLGMAYGW